MCGLIFAIRYDGKPARKMVLKRYQEQQTRGRNGFGFIPVEEGKMEIIHRATTEWGIRKTLEHTKAEAILFHHRTPTSTENIVAATHPIEVKHQDFKYAYYVIHNGVISNTTELKPKHEAAGFIYQTLIQTIVKTRLSEDVSENWNDSESLAIETALFLEGKKETLDFTGSAALIAFQVKKDTKEINAVFFGRNYQNPLKLEETEEFLCLSSEGTGTVIEPGKMFRLNPVTKRIEERKVEFGKFPAYNYNRKQDDLDLPSVPERRYGFQKNPSVLDARIRENERKSLPPPYRDIQDNIEDLKKKISVSEDKKPVAEIESMLGNLSSIKDMARAGDIYGVLEEGEAILTSLSEEEAYLLECLENCQAYNLPEEEEKDTRTRLAEVRREISEYHSILATYHYEGL